MGFFLVYWVYRRELHRLKSLELPVRILSFEIQNLAHESGILLTIANRNPSSTVKESSTWNLGNPQCGIQNPKLSAWINKPQSRFLGQGIRNPDPSTWNPALQRGIQNPRMSWISFHGAKIEVHILRACSICQNWSAGPLPDQSD